MSDQPGGQPVGSENMGARLFQLLATVYGPYAFGLVSLMVVWYFIVSPQLERQSVDFRKNEELVTSLRAVATSLEAASRSMERTATVFDALMQKNGLQGVTK